MRRRRKSRRTNAFPLADSPPTCSPARQQRVTKEHDNKRLQQKTTRNHRTSTKTLYYTNTPKHMTNTRIKMIHTPHHPWQQRTHHGDFRMQQQLKTHRTLTNHRTTKHEKGLNKMFRSICFSRTNTFQ